MTTACQARSMMKLPKRYAPVLFALLMSISLSGLMSFVITAINTGLDGGFIARWLRSYALAWSMAFPLVTIAAPRVRSLVDHLTN